MRKYIILLAIALGGCAHTHVNECQEWITITRQHNGEPFFKNPSDLPEGKHVAYCVAFVDERYVK